jgi:hypothetical protein
MEFPADACFSKQSLDKKTYIYARTCLVKTTKRQRALLNKRIQASRVIYNAALESVQTKQMPVELS